MNEARALLARLDRIEALERAGTPASAILAEVRALVREAERWARREQVGDSAAAALARCRSALAR